MYINSHTYPLHCQVPWWLASLCFLGFLVFLGLWYLCLLKHIQIFNNECKCLDPIYQLLIFIKCTKFTSIYCGCNLLQIHTFLLLFFVWFGTVLFVILYKKKEYIKQYKQNLNIIMCKILTLFHYNIKIT